MAAILMAALLHRRPHCATTGRYRVDRQLD
jgi:hypothetical protein